MGPSCSMLMINPQHARSGPPSGSSCVGNPLPLQAHPVLDKTSISIPSYFQVSSQGVNQVAHRLDKSSKLGFLVKAQSERITVLAGVKLFHTAIWLFFA